MRIVGIEEHVNRPNVMERMTYLPDALRAKLLPSVEQQPTWTRPESPCRSSLHGPRSPGLIGRS